MVSFNRCYQQFKRVAIRAVCLLMVTAVVWSGGWVGSANAVGSSDAAGVMQDRAASEVDRTVGSGTVDQLEGAARQAKGKVQRNFGDATDDLGTRIEGAGSELKGKVQRDVGRTKSKASDVGDDLEDAADSVVDSVKDFFN